jgi:hypothetical protein
MVIRHTSAREAYDEPMAADPAERWSTERSEATFREVSPGVLLFAFKGHMAAELVAKISGAVAPFVERREQFDVFFDTEKMTGYEPAFRQRMTAWHEEVKPWTRSAGVLVSSKIVSMAISVANLVTGGILKTFADRPSFEARIAEAAGTARATRPSIRPS